MRRGLTLVEALIAGVLLAVGLLPVVFLRTTTTRETAMDLRQLEATALANELLEQVRAMAEGRIGVPAMGSLPCLNSFPDFPEWVDIEALLKGKAGAVSLLDATEFLRASSRVYLASPREGFHRYLQFMRAPLLKGDTYASSPHLLEIRVKVEYGPPGARPDAVRRIVLDTLVSDEDITSVP